MERKFLEGLGLDKDTVDKIMTAHGKTIESHKATAETAAKDRDTYKGQLDEVSKQLEAFAGVDIDALRGEVKKLKADLTTKDAEYQSKLADRDFQALLTTSIMAASGKNPKAITALLDTETLKASKNQKADVEAALKALSESDAYLFESGKVVDTAPVPSATPARISTGGAHDESGRSTPVSTNAQMNALIAGKLKGE